MENSSIQPTIGNDQNLTFNYLSVKKEFEMIHLQPNFSPKWKRVMQKHLLPSVKSQSQSFIDFLCARARPINVSKALSLSHVLLEVLLNRNGLTAQPRD